jgi:predicted nucleic acid-binding protein
VVKVFLDTNVLVSGFATRGLCADVIRLVLAEHELVPWEVVLNELKQVLKPKIQFPTEQICVNARLDSGLGSSIVSCCRFS